jgi:hypothetical protein
LLMSRDAPESNSRRLFRVVRGISPFTLSGMPIRYYNLGFTSGEQKKGSRVAPTTPENRYKKRHNIPMSDTVP